MGRTKEWYSELQEENSIVSCRYVSKVSDVLAMAQSEKLDNNRFGVVRNVNTQSQFGVGDVWLNGAWFFLWIKQGKIDAYKSLADLIVGETLILVKV